MLELKEIVYTYMGNDHLISCNFTKESKKVFSIWHVEGFEMNLIRQFESKIEIIGCLWLEAPTDFKLFGYLFSNFQILNSSGNILKTIEINRSVERAQVVDEFLLIETSKPSIQIWSTKTYQLLREIEKSDCIMKFAGHSPYEIFIKDETNDCLLVYALDHDFTYLGTLDTREMSKYPIESLIYVSELTGFIFKTQKYYFDSSYKIFTTKCVYKI